MEMRFKVEYRSESDSAVFFHNREAVILGSVKIGKVEKSQAFQITEEDDFKSLEDTLQYYHSQKYHALKVEVSATYGTRKR